MQDEIEIEYNEFGEVIQEVYEPEVKLALFLSDMNRTREEWDARCNETVLSYRLMKAEKSPNKLSAFERHSLYGEPYTPVLNRLQRQRLAQQAEGEG